MLSWIGVLVVAFRRVQQALAASRHESREKQFVIWAIGAILFGHASTFLAICYFDQSLVFFVLLLAIIASLPKPVRTRQRVAMPVFGLPV
jgi:low temperature requirement protein LtrA